MSWKRTLINLLDSRVGRPLLARLATARARQWLHEDVDIDFDVVWHHRVGPYFVPDGSRFEYYKSTILAWKDEIPTYFRDAADFWFLHYKPKLGDVIIDIGAGRGEDVLPFARAAGSTGRIVAIEAHPATFYLLRRFCQLNDLTNVIAIHAALMDEPGAVKIQNGERWEANTIRSTGDGTYVTATTVDLICKQQGIDRIDFLKMNIEGAETKALLGMKETISKVETICVCCHDFRADRGHGEEYRTRDCVVELLTQNGFVVSRRAQDPRDYVRDHVFGTRLGHE